MSSDARVGEGKAHVTFPTVESTLGKMEDTVNYCQTAKTPQMPRLHWEYLDYWLSAGLPT